MPLTAVPANLVVQYTVSPAAGAAALRPLDGRANRRPDTPAASAEGKPTDSTNGDAKTADKAQSNGTPTRLSDAALAQLAKLKARDLEVRQHEAAHLAVAGSLATSGASYSYQKGPDGVNYAIGGEVGIDTSPGRTPQETIDKARTVQAAALAPAEPSGPDLAVAAQAQQLEAQARGELARQQTQVNQTYGVGKPSNSGSLSVFA